LGGYFESLSFNLRNLTRVSGRTRRSRFWPYAVTVIIASMLVAAAVAVPMLVDAFQKMLAYVVEHPEQATVMRTPTSVSVSIKNPPLELIPNLRIVLRAVGLAILAIVVLLGAAISRRLHDADSSILWGIAPLPFIAFSLTMFAQLLDRFAAGGEFGDLFVFLLVSNLIYLVGLGNLVIRLCQRSQSGANRFGPPERRA
jgi:uncharacterized membrane protein YhaH (DUF805 family)